MRHTIKAFFFALTAIFIGLSVPALSAQENEPTPLPLYGLGDQMFAINVGLFIPLFFHNPGVGTSPTNLSLGGAGSLEWAAFLNDKVSLGAELQGIFSISPLKRTLLMIPISAKLSYFFQVISFRVSHPFRGRRQFCEIGRRTFCGTHIKTRSFRLLEHLIPMVHRDKGRLLVGASDLSQRTP